MHFLDKIKIGNGRLEGKLPSNPWMIPLSWKLHHQFVAFILYSHCFLIGYFLIIITLLLKLHSCYNCFLVIVTIQQLISNKHFKK
jgi:hypothetical protein